MEIPHLCLSPTRHWSYGYIPSWPTFTWVSGIWMQVSCLHSKHFTYWLVLIRRDFSLGWPALCYCGHNNFNGKEVVPSLPGDKGIWESHPNPWEQSRLETQVLRSLLFFHHFLFSSSLLSTVCWVECTANAMPCSSVPFSYLEVDQMLLHCALSLISSHDSCRRSAMVTRSPDCFLKIVLTQGRDKWARGRSKSWWGGCAFLIWNK